jgi:hypothetical protein
MDFPVLDFDGPRSKLAALVFETEQFCKDPVNIMMTEKRYMVRKFWRMLVDQARKIFNEARSDTERWLAAVPLPLETQIKDHKAQLQARLDSLAKVNERGGTINEEVNKLQAQRKDVQRQIQMITALILKVRDVGPSPDSQSGNATMRAAAAPIAPAAAPAGGAAPVPPPATPAEEPQPAYLKTQKMVAVKEETRPEFMTTQKLDLNGMAKQ